MSVIGTTLKQPRVFSHDAIALADLPACVYRPIGSVIIVDYIGQPSIFPNTTPGAGFIAGEIYDAISVINPGAEGSSFQVEVTAVGTAGEILTMSFVTPTCDSEKSTNMNKEDLFDVVWSPRQGQQWNEPGVASAVKLLEVNLDPDTTWDYGCPFTPIIRRDLIGNIDLFRLQRTYKQKDIIKYTCDTCEWETYGPGASLYVGYDLSELTVIMESGKKVTWSNVPAGSFMPVSVLTVCEAIAAGPVGDAPDADALKTLILALF